MEIFTCTNRFLHTPSRHRPKQIEHKWAKLEWVRGGVAFHSLPAAQGGFSLDWGEVRGGVREVCRDKSHTRAQGSRLCPFWGALLLMHSTHDRQRWDEMSKEDESGGCLTPSSTIFWPHPPLFLYLSLLPLYFLHSMMFLSPSLSPYFLTLFLSTLSLFLSISLSPL